MSESDRKTAYQSAEVYRDTRYFLEAMIREIGLYPEIMEALRNGKGSVELRKRVMLRAIDEAWVSAIEDSLDALDEIIRQPSRFIDEEEEVLPIELTKTVSQRAVKHLAQHTDYISEIRGEDIIPSKLLNVNRVETMQTYENKFVNTLVEQLYSFVNYRYDAAKAAGQDTTNIAVEFKNEFTHGEVKGKLQLRMEIEEPSTPENTEGVEKNYLFVSDLWKRVERLHRICDDYMQSDFVRDMGKSYIRPPVMRTNAILKNRNLRQCLALWEFIEGYENAGYTTMVEDQLLEMDEGHIRDLYAVMTMEYLLFRQHVDKGFDENREIAHASTDAPLAPEIVEELSPATVSEFAVHVEAIRKAARVQTVEETELLEALEVALFADEVLRRRAELKKLSGKYQSYDSSHRAKIILAGEPLQSYYTEIKNRLLSYRKVQEKGSWKFENFLCGRKICARLAVKGKTLMLYLPLDPANEAYSTMKVTDMSRSAAYRSLPLGLKIRSRKALGYALQLIDEAMEQLQIEREGSPVTVDYRTPMQTREELIAEGLIKVVREIPEEAPAVEEPPVVEEETPVVAEETPVVEEEAPVVAEETPVVVEEVPAVEEEVPAVEEEVPAVEEEAPVVEEEVPAVEEEAPVVEEEVPVVEEEAPVVEEETPAVVEETPAVVEKRSKGLLGRLFNSSKKSR